MTFSGGTPSLSARAVFSARFGKIFLRNKASSRHLCSVVKVILSFFDQGGDEGPFTGVGSVRFGNKSEVKNKLCY